MISLALFLLACGPGGSGPGTVEGDSGGPGPDLGVTPIPGRTILADGVLTAPVGESVPCSEDSGIESTLDDLDLDSELSTWMPTVLHVTWAEVPGEIHYDDGRSQRVARGHSTVVGYETWLVGPKPLAEVSWWFQADDGAGCSDERTTAVGELTATPVQGLVETPGSGTPVEGLVMVSWFGDPGMVHDLRGGMALMDRDGEAVWSVPALFGYRIAAAEWTETGVWTLQEIEAGSKGENVVVFIGADGQIGTMLSVPDAHHDLAVLADGSPVWLETDVRLVDDAGPVIGEPVEVVGDRVVRAQNDGTTEVLFETWGVFEVVGEESLTWDTDFYGDARDWTHANGLTVSVERDSMLLTLLGLSMVLEVDFESGSVVWSLRSRDLEEPETRFDAIHGPVWSDTDKVKVFVNAPMGGATVSYAAEFDLSLDPVREVWNSGRDDSSRYSPALGRVAQLASDHTLVNYGSEGLVEEIDIQGRPQWRWSLDSEWVLGESGVVTLYED